MAGEKNGAQEHSNHVRRRRRRACIPVAVFLLFPQDARGRGSERAMVEARSGGVVVLVVLLPHLGDRGASARLQGECK